MLRTALTALLLASGCRAAEPMDACDLDPAHCLPCAADDECVFTGNPCLEKVYCAHEDAEIAVIQIGCSEALEYRWPDASACTCEGTCTAE